MWEVEFIVYYDEDATADLNDFFLDDRKDNNVVFDYDDHPRKLPYDLTPPFNIKEEEDNHARRIEADSRRPTELTGEKRLIV